MRNKIAAELHAEAVKLIKDAENLIIQADDLLSNAMQEADDVDAYEYVLAEKTLSHCQDLLVIFADALPEDEEDEEDDTDDAGYAVVHKVSQEVWDTYDSQEAAEATIETFDNPDDWVIIN